MFILLMLLSLANAETHDLRSIKAKTHTRDNSYCRIGGKRVEIEIRSEKTFTEPKEKPYGEYVFYYYEKKPALLPLNAEKLHSFRFFLGLSEVCSKSYGYVLNNNKIAILFLKENRPFMDKLALQIFDNKTVTAEKVIETDYTSDTTELYPNGFIFRSYIPRESLEMGSVKIHGIEYFFQDRDFPYWIKFNSDNFETEPTLSYQRFPWKDHFKDENDFLNSAGWDSSTKKFTKTSLYFAVNHKEKKNCVLLMSTKSKLTGQETWHCN